MPKTIFLFMVKSEMFRMLLYRIHLPQNSGSGTFIWNVKTRKDYSVISFAQMGNSKDERGIS